MQHMRKTLTVVALAILTATAAEAASRNAPPSNAPPSNAAPSNAPATNVPGTSAPPSTGPKDNGRGNGQTPGGDGPSRPGGGNASGLPDAVTVLEILRRLPRWPGGRDGPQDDGGPDGPAGEPGGNAGPPGKKPPQPPRVVAIAPNVPFKPTPTPRTGGAPPAVTGAVAPDQFDREVLVTLTAGSDAETVRALSQDFGLDGNTVYVSPLLGVRIVRFLIPDTRSVADVVGQLASDARVQVAQPHYAYVASANPSVALPAPQYAPQKLKLDEAHKMAQGKRVKVAVIDTAVDTSHPAFKGARIETFDALGGSKSDPELHGTAIAGILSARAGLEGVAPEASLLAVRAFTAGKSGAPSSNTLALLKALDWAVMSGARVINMSFAGPQDPILAKAIDAADAQGIVLVAAAGNGGPQAKPAYPAALPAVIAVTATSDSDELYKDANRGAYIAVAAPGVDIVAAAPKGAYDISSGTSLAAAHVSGIAALMLELNPKMTSADVREAISGSAHKLPGRPKEEVGAGIADAEAALKAAK